MRHTLSAAAAAAVPAPMPFVAVAPCRLVDTRGNGQTGAFGPPSLGINGQRDIPIQSHPVCTGIPANAGAYSLNMTVTNTGSQPFGFLKAWPAGGAEPNVSTLNYPAPGATLANAAVVSAGTAGAISIRSGNAGADVVIDINGYYAPQATVTSLNALSGDVVLAAGSNVTFTPVGQTLTIDASSPAGPMGPQGPAGVQGQDGPQGPAGPAGAAGATGATGPQGADGPQGPIGPTGLTGLTGATGAAGSAGDKGDKGDKGDIGAVGLVWQSAWDVNTTYALGDAVSLNGSGYISLGAGNVGNQPDSSPAQWAVLALRGDKGDAGAQGDPGPAGAPGAPGAPGTPGATGPPGPPGFVAKGSGTTNGGGVATITNAAITTSSLVILTYTGNVSVTAPLTIHSIVAGSAQVKGDSSKGFVYVIFN